MKRSMTTLMLATAALMVASTVASAGDLAAKIPFSFYAHGKSLAAGSYLLKANSGEMGFRLMNLQTGEITLLTPGTPRDARKEWNAASNGILQFTCGDRGCALRELWTNTGFSAHVYSLPKAEDGMSARVAMIRIAVH